MRTWRDPKRSYWLLGLSVPLLPFFAWEHVAATSWGVFWWIGPLVSFGLVPFVDLAIGKDASNPPESAVDRLENDTYYRWCVVLFLPLQFVSLVFACWMWTYGGLTAYRDNADFYYHAARISPAYDLADRQAIDAGGELSIPALLPDMRAIDFSSTTRVSFPVIMFVGRHDLTTPSAITERWLAALHAPSKRLVWFENSAHMMPIEEPGRMLVSLVSYARPFAVH